LHGGKDAFHNSIWHIEHADQSSIRYSLFSPNGENGFPGTLKVSITYTLNDENKLQLDYSCTTDQTTHVNFTHHSYFNLSGGHSNHILNHQLYINSSEYLAIDNLGLPTNSVKVETDPVFDFRKFKAIGKDIDSNHQQLTMSGGYDHNFILQKQDAPIAKLIDPDSGRQLTLYSSEPGLQFFSGNFSRTIRNGKKNASYHKHAGLCLEPQHFPNTPNRPDFPSTLLMAGENFQSHTVFEFGVI
jgi:aldose 1-epimerase